MMEMSRSHMRTNPEKIVGVPRQLIHKKDSVLRVKGTNDHDAPSLTSLLITFKICFRCFCRNSTKKQSIAFMI